TENFFRDIMSSIKDNLTMIDRQLMLVYNHLNGMDASNSLNKKNQLQSLLSKIIHDIYIVKIRQELGFIIDFKKTTDLIVNYIFMKGGPEETENYSANFLRILNRLNEIGENEISFNNYINFEREIFFNDCFTRNIGNSILDVINKDFRWNLFFRIIFEIEEGNKAEDFEGFMIFIRYRFYENLAIILKGKEMTKEEKEEVLNEIMDQIALSFIQDVDVDFLCDCSIRPLNRKIDNQFRDICNYEEWKEKKEEILKLIMNHEY
ncbi:MAG: (p)ppGpp synthetase, partial [Tissierellaceae bacterium]